MSRTYSSGSGGMDGTGAPFTTTPGTAFAWIKRAAAGSFGRFYLSFGQGGVDTDKFLIGEEITGSSGKSAAYAYGGGSINGAIDGVVATSTWQLVTGRFASTSSRTVKLSGSAKVTSTNVITNPSTVNKTVVNGRIVGHSNGVTGQMAHFGGVPRLYDDVEISYLEAGGNFNYLPHAGGSYYYGDQSATEPDKWSSRDLTVTGTTAGSDDPDIASYWTATAQGNQSATQGSTFPAIDLTTKFDNVHAAFTCALLQVGSAGTALSANGAGTTSNLLVVTGTAPAVGSYVSIAGAAKTLVLFVSGQTLLIATAQSWNNSDSVVPYTVSAPTGLTSNGYTITANVTGGTVGAGAVGTYANCLYRSTSSGANAAIADSALHTITVASSGAAPSFSAGPTLTSANTDGYTYGGTSNQTATWHLGVYLKGSAVPSKANLKAGAGTGFISHFTQALTAATPGSLSATALTLPLHDVHHLVTNGSGDSAIASNLATFIAPPAGKQYTTLTILPITAITKANPAQVTQTAHGRSTGDYVEIFGVGGMTQVNAFFGTITKVDANNYTLDGIDSTAYTTYTSGGDATWGQSLAYNASTRLVTGDVLITDATTREAGAAVAVRPDGSISYSGVLTRQSVQADAYSVSGGALLGVGTSYVNNIPPNGPGLFPPALFLPLNQSASVNLSTYFTSPELDTLGMSASGLMAGLSVVTPNLIGVPTVRAITGITITAQDLAGETSSTVLTIVAGNVDVPPLAGLDQPSVIALLAANYLNVQFGTQDDANPLGPAAAGIAIAQTPASGTAVPNSVINVTLSSGNAPPVVTPVTSASGDVLSNQLTQGLQLDPLSPGYLAGANSWDVVDVCVMLPTHQPGQVYRFFKLPSNARVVTLEMINDANPLGSSYSIGVRQTIPKGGALPTTPQRNPIAGAISIFNSNVSLDIETPRWESVYLPAIVGSSPNKKHFILRVWELLGLIADPTDIYEVVVTARTPGIAGGNLGLRMTYVR